MAGNATLTTVNGNWEPIVTSLYLQSIETGSSVEFDDNQLHRGISYRPIRRIEMFLDFTSVWSLQNYYLMDQFQEAIRTHYLQIVAGSPTPMTLNYFGTSYSPMNISYNGWIESAEKEYPRFDDIFVRNYRMNILLPEKVGAVLPVSSVITPSYLNVFGQGWYSTTPVNTNYSGPAQPNGLINNPHIRPASSI